MGAATSSTSKVVLVSRSTRPGCDVDYLFGQVAIDEPVIDWSGNCGNLTGAVGPFAIAEAYQAPRDGTAVVRIWQANVGKRIVAHVPMQDGEVVEEGDFLLDGVTFPSAEMCSSTSTSAAATTREGGAMFPTGGAWIRSSARAWDYRGDADHGGQSDGLRRAAAAWGSRPRDAGRRQRGCGAPRALRGGARHAAVAMGLASSPEDATRDARPRPRCLRVPAAILVASERHGARPANRPHGAHRLDGKLHHAMTGTGAVAIAVAAAIPGTIVHRRLRAGRRSVPGALRASLGHAERRRGGRADGMAQWIVRRPS